MFPPEKTYLMRFLLPMGDAVNALTIDQAQEVARMRLAGLPPGSKLLGVWEAGGPLPDGIAPAAVGTPPTKPPTPPRPRGLPPSGGTPAAGRVAA